MLEANSIVRMRHQSSSIAITLQTRSGATVSGDGHHASHNKCVHLIFRDTSTGHPLQYVCIVAVTALGYLDPRRPDAWDLLARFAHILELATGIRNVAIHSIFGRSLLSTEGR